MKITKQDLKYIYIQGTNINVLDAPDHTFKKWVRESLVNAGYTPNEIAIEYEITEAAKLKIVSQMIDLRVEIPVRILK